MPKDNKIGGSVDLRQVLKIEVTGAHEAELAIKSVETSVQNLGKALSSMARGNDLSKYWNTNESSIEGVMKAYERFQNIQNETNAGGLIKSLNAFIAQGGEANVLIERYGENARELVRIAGQLAPTVREAFDVSSLREAFQTFDEFKKNGIELQEVFEKLNSESPTQLKNALEQTNYELSKTKRALAETQTELDTLLNNGDISAFKDKLDTLESQIEFTTHKMQNEFRAFLQANNFSGYDLWDDGRFSSFFQSIAEGSMTAQEAIGEFKQQYDYLLREQASAGNAFDAGQASEFSEKLAEACRSIELMRQDLVSLANNGVLTEMSRSLSENTVLTNEQRNAMSELVQNGGELNSVVQILAELIRASGEATEGVNANYEAIRQLIEAASHLGSIDVDALEVLRGVLMSFVKMDGLEVSDTALKSIINAIDSLTRIQNSGALSIISNVDLHGFDNLHVSKASLKNLSDNLPIIARADVQAIRDLANIDFSRLSELKISKPSADNLRELARVVTEVRDTLGTVEANTDGTSNSIIGSRSTEQVDQLRAHIAELYNEAEAYSDSFHSRINSIFDDVNSRMNTLRNTLEAIGSNPIKIDSSAYSVVPGSAGKRVSAKVNTDYQSQLEAEWQNYYRKLSEEAQKMYDAATKASSHYYTVEEEKAKKRLADEEALTRKLIDEWNRAEDKVVEAAQQQAQRRFEIEQTYAQKESDEQIEAINRKRRDEEKYYSERDAQRQKDRQREEETLQKELAQMDDVLQRRTQIESEYAHKESDEQIEAMNRKHRDEEAYYAKRDEMRRKDAEKESALIQKELEQMEADIASREQAAQRQEQVSTRLNTQVVNLRTQYIQLQQQHETTYNAHKADIDAFIEKMKDAGSISREEYLEMRQQFALYMEEVKTGAEAQQRANEKQMASEQQVIALRNQISAYMNNNTKAVNTYGAYLDDLMSRLQSGAKLTDVELQQIRMEFDNIKNAASLAGATGKTFFETLQNGWRRFGGWSIVTRSMMLVIRGFKQMVTSVKEVDAAMTELKKITHLTDVEYNRFYSDAVKISKKLGSTVSDTINAAADFARLGFDVNDSLDIAQAALVYKNVGYGIESINEASESLTSTIKAFGEETYDAMEIVDMFNEVGNHFAISSKGVGDALMRSAAALANAGNSLEESIALVTAANAVIQNPESVGTSMKTLTMYLRAAKTELEEAGEDAEGCADSVSKLREELKALTGVDIMINESTFKSTYQIIKEISEIWDSLSDTTQANVTGLIGGKRNANVIAALMTNFKDAENALQTASNAAGSALAENEKYLASIAGKIDLLKGKAEAFANSFISSDVIKFVVDAGSGIMDILNGLISINALLPTIIAAVTGISLAGMAKDIATATAKITAEVVATGAATDAAKLSLGHLTAVEKALTLAQLDQALATKVAAGQIDAKAAAAARAALAEEAHAAANIGVFSSLKKMFTVMPMWSKIALGAAAAVGVLVTIAGAVEKSKEEMIEAANQSKEAFEDTEKTYTKNLQALDKLEPRFKLLSKNVKENGKNAGLTAEEYEEYQNIIQQIIEISPTIVERYDAEKNAIMDYKNAIEAAREAQEKFYNSKKQSYFDDMGKRYEGWQNEIEKIRNEAFNLNYGFSDNLSDSLLGFFDALESIGMDIDARRRSYQAYAQIPFFDIDELRHMVDERKNIIQSLINSDEYDKTSINEIDMWLGQVQQRIESESEIYKKAEDDLREWVEYQDWFIDSTDKNLAQAFSDRIGILFDNQDQPLDAAEKWAEAEQLFADVENAMASLSDGSDLISLDFYYNMIDAISDGTESLENFDEHLSSLHILDWEYGKDVVDIIIGCLHDAAVAVEQTSNSITGTVTNTVKTVKGFADAVDQLRDGYNLLDKAQGEMQDDGGLSIDTIKSIHDALSDSEKLTDYLYEENGAIKLNIKAWKDRARSIAENDVAAMQQEIQSLNGFLISARYDGSISLKSVEEAKTRIAELEAEIAIYKAILEQPIENEDPLDLTGMFSNIGSVESKASSLTKALEEIKEGALQDWNDLVSKNPDLMSLSGLFDIKSLEGQEEAMRKVLADYDLQIDDYIDKQIGLLQKTRDIAVEAGESTDIIDVFIENLEKFRDASLTDSIDNQKEKSPFEGLTETLQKASKYANIVHDALDGVDLDSITELRDTFGEDWDQYTIKDQNGNILGIDSDKLKSLIDNALDLYDASEQVKTAFNAMWAEALKSDKTETQFERMTTAIKKTNEAISMTKDLFENGYGLDTLESLRDFFGEGEDEMYQYFAKLAQSNFPAFKKELFSYVETLYDAAGATASETEAMHNAWKDATNSIITDIGGVSDALSKYQESLELLGNIRAGGLSQIELIEQMLKLSESSGISIDKLLSVDGKTIKAGTTALKQYTDNLLSWNKLKNVPGMTREIASGIRQAAKAVTEAEQATNAWNDALSAVDKVTSVIDSIESGEDLLSIIPNIQEIAADTGKSIEDFFDIVNGKVYWDETAISEWAFSYVENLKKVGQITPSTARHLKNLAAAQIEASVSMGKLNNAANMFSDADGAIAGVSIDGKITYDQFQSLINVSKDYSKAIEYNNGVITVSKKKFDSITKSILNTQKAEAIAQRDAILLGNEYKRLIALEKEHKLSTIGRDKLKDLEVEAASWNVIATEIENANMAYQKFLHADDEPSGEQYSAAEKAKKVINDTLFDKESEIYGKRGRSQYKYAVEFLIEPKAKLGTKEFDKSWKKVKRYMADNGEGLQNFIDDLIKKGLASQVDGANVTLDTTLEEIAKKLHISEDLVRALIEEWNTYTSGDGISVGPTVDENAQEETKSKLTETEEAVDSLISKTDELQDKAIDFDTDPAVEKLENVESLFQDVYLDIDLIGDHTVNVNTNPAVKAVNILNNHLGNVLNTLNTIIKNGIIDIDVRETYTRTIVEEGLAAVSGYTPKRKNGRSAADGHMGAPGGKTLVGELGTEIIVDPNTNTWYTVGEKGAEFRNIPAGALVFNATQTQALLRSGHIYSRAGNSMVSGNAAANVKGTDANGGSNKQQYIYVVRKRSNGRYVAIKGSYNWCQDWMKSHDAYRVEDFTYSSFDSAKEYAYWANVNLDEQEKAKKTSQSSSKGTAKTTTSSTSKGSTKKTTTKTTKTTKTTGSNTSKIPKSISKSSGTNSGSSGYSGDISDDVYDDDIVDPIDELAEAYKKLNDELDHLIQHQLYLYDVANRALNYNGMEKSLEEQAKIYKLQMQRAQDGIDELIAKGVDDTDERLQQVEEMYWAAHRSLYDTYDKINALYVDGLNQQIDSLQGAVDTLDSVAESLTKNDVIGVDMLQSLLDNGIQYLDLIDKVGDQYVVNKDAVEAMLRAEKEQLAVQSALSYLQSIYEAATDGSINKLRELANASQSIGTDNWGAVLSMLAEISSIGTVPADLMESIVKNVNNLRDLTGYVVMDTKEAEQKTAEILEHLEDQESALDKIVDFTEDMIKTEVNDHIKAIQKEVDLFREIVDLKKKSLDTTREEESYQRNVNDKLKEINDLQIRIDKLSLDDSRTAQAERMSLMEELAEKQRDLSDLQSDYSYEAQVEALDKMATEYEEERQTEIDALEESISSAEKIYQLAIDRITNQWDTLYTDLINWNIESGSVLTSEITDNWGLAYEAARKYGDYVHAMKGIHEELLANDKENTTLKYRVEDLFDVSEIQSRSSTSNSSDYSRVQEAVSDGVEKGLDAFVAEQEEFMLGEFVPRYHGGGVVDDRGSMNSKEALAVLQKGEVVLDQNEQKTLFRLIDLKNFLSEKLGSAIGDITAIPRNLATQLTEAMGNTPVLATAGNNQSIDFRPEINVRIEGLDSSDAAARRYGETIADTTLEKLYSTFERRGISNIFSGRLKG